MKLESLASFTNLLKLFSVYGGSSVLFSY